MRQLRTICVITGTRAEYGLLAGVMQKIQACANLKLQIIVTGMHLSPEFGLTYQAIEDDGFIITEKVEMLLSADTPTAIAKSIGLGVIGFADALARLEPDLLVVLGDRYEILAAVQAALVAKIPVAHIGGGDTTEGAFDEAIRHSITKMSHLHFVTNALSGSRVAQLGENPDHIFVVGSPGIDQIMSLELLDKASLAESLDYKFRPKNLLITFHPVTLDAEAPTSQFKLLLAALERLGSDVGLIFTKPNADTHGRELIQLVDEFVASHEQAKAFVSLGQMRYLSTMAVVDAVVGNSSSGLYEAPTLKTPTVNIGDRQQGRLKATSVIDCAVEVEAIYQAITRAFTLDCTNVHNPYGDGRATVKIIDIINRDWNWQALLKKHFYFKN